MKREDKFIAVSLLLTAGWLAADGLFFGPYPLANLWTIPSQIEQNEREINELREHDGT